MTDHKKVLVIEIDAAELAVRMCEASYQIKRPPGSSAKFALDNMDDDARDRWLRAAVTAIKFFRDCVNKNVTTNLTH